MGGQPGLRPFEEVVVEHGTAVLRVCRALLGTGDADDAWAETFLAALRAYPSLRPGSNVRGWLVTIAYRKALDHLRAGRRRPRPSAEIQEVQTFDEPREPDPELMGELSGLPSKQRAAVVYRYLADLPYAEVARLLECTEAAARRSASDGIARLRAHYLKGAAP